MSTTRIALVSVTTILSLIAVARSQEAPAAPRGPTDVSEPPHRQRIERMATTGPTATGPTTTSTAAEKLKPSEEPVITDHSITIDGQPFRYKATAGTIPLKDDSGKTRAKMFFVAYEKPAPTTAPSDRPITFVFNGGPGAAAIWLHLGTAGPMRVHLPDNGFPPAPPYKLDENPQTWLAATDLVFIDPVGTGYSRADAGEQSASESAPSPPGGPERTVGPRRASPTGEASAREFYSVQGDISSVADFIRIYLTRYQRWTSPKYLAGESYGTTRAAGLSEYLHDRYGIDLQGIVLVSTVLNFETLSFSSGNDIPYPLYLPSFTAIAWYHKKLPQDLQGRDLKDVVAVAQKWALSEYNAALLKGTSLSNQEREQIAQLLSHFTGLPIEYVRRANLRIGPFRFEKQLLADKEQLIGRMDGRVSGHDLDPLNDSPDFDPSLTGYVGPFSSAFNEYIRRELKYQNDNVYEFLSPRVGPWDFGPAGSGYLNVATTLQRCLAKVPTLKIFIASGYYDLATPFTATDYTINSMPLSKELRGNVTHSYYEGGHMLYLNRPSLEKLNSDLKQFFTSNAGH